MHFFYNRNSFFLFSILIFVFSCQERSFYNTFQRTDQPKVIVRPTPPDYYSNPYEFYTPQNYQYYDYDQYYVPPRVYYNGLEQNYVNPYYRMRRVVGNKGEMLYEDDLSH